MPGSPGGPACGAAAAHANAVALTIPRQVGCVSAAPTLESSVNMAQHSTELSAQLLELVHSWRVGPLTGDEFRQLTATAHAFFNAACSMAALTAGLDRTAGCT